MNQLGRRAEDPDGMQGPAVWVISLLLALGAGTSLAIPHAVPHPATEQHP